VALPRVATKPRPRARLAPSRRSVVIGLGLLAAAAAAYGVARGTSLFAIRSVQVVGAPAPVAAQVKRALRPLLGTSLVGLDGGAVLRRIDALPTVVSAGYDRAFPHTLRITVVPERPVAVLRQGGEAWLVSARGRLVARVGRADDASMARIWVSRSADVGGVGAFLAPDAGGVAARALAFARDFPTRIVTARFANGSLTFQLASGVSLRLGDGGAMPLKLAVARRALRVLPAGTTYLDVSLPGRPVSGSEALPAQSNPQVSSGG